MTEAVLERDAASSPAAKSRPRPARRKPLIYALALLGVVAATRYGYRWWTQGRFLEQTDDAYVGGEVTVVASKVSGLVAEVAASDNQSVRAGELLVKIDDRDYRAILAKAEAVVAGQIATLANLDATRRLQQAVVAQARAGVAAADAEITRTRFDQSRFQELSAKAAASTQTFQKADADYKQALAAGERARAISDAAERQLDVIDAQKRQAEAALAGAKADRDLAALNVSYTEIRAPIDGVVGNRSARVGGFAAVGAKLLSVVPSQGLWVDANFKESQIVDLRPGLSATIEPDVAPGQIFSGHVASLAPATGARFSILPPENATGNFTKIVQRVPVRIVLDGEASALGRLRPGLSVTVQVDRRDKDKP
ncbi:MAG: hemolysin D [Methylocystaceae bacterium]|nr:MAG: hemolysin D [Methylocystaceae bacterium]